MRSAVDVHDAWRELSDWAASLTQQPAPTVIHFARFEQPFLSTLVADVVPLDVVCTRDIARRLFRIRLAAVSEPSRTWLRLHDGRPDTRGVLFAERMRYWAPKAPAFFPRIR